MTTTGEVMLFVPGTVCQCFQHNLILLIDLMDLNILKSTLFFAIWIRPGTGYLNPVIYHENKTHE